MSGAVLQALAFSAGLHHLSRLCHFWRALFVKDRYELVLIFAGRGHVSGLMAWRICTARAAARKPGVSITAVRVFRHGPADIPVPRHSRRPAPRLTHRSGNCPSPVRGRWREPSSSVGASDPPDRTPTPPRFPWPVKARLNPHWILTLSVVGERLGADTTTKNDLTARSETTCRSH